MWPRVPVPILAVCLLGGCGLSDHYTAIPLPAMLKYDAPLSKDADGPDIAKLAKKAGRGLFSNKPGRVEVSQPFLNAFTRTYEVCARTPEAVWHPTMVAKIIRDDLVDRRRARPDDQCDRREYITVSVD